MPERAPPASSPEPADLPRLGEARLRESSHSSIAVERPWMLRALALLVHLGRQADASDSAILEIDREEEDYVVEPLVPSPHPDTPATVAGVFKGVDESKILPAYFDSPYDPSSGVPSTDPGEPIGDDAELFWKIRTGRESLIQPDKP